MRMTKFRLSPAAAQEMEQLRCALGDVALVLQWGRRDICQAEIRFTLGERELAYANKRDRRRLAGLTVVADGASIISVTRQAEDQPNDPTDR